MVAHRPSQRAPVGSRGTARDQVVHRRKTPAAFNPLVTDPASDGGAKRRELGKAAGNIASQLADGKQFTDIEGVVDFTTPGGNVSNGWARASAQTSSTFFQASWRACNTL